MISFDLFSLKLKLYDHKSVLVPNVEVKVQYYNPEMKEWVVIFTNKIINGILDIRGSVGGSGAPLEEFYSMIRNYKMPLVRVAPLKNMEGVTKQIVIASTFSFGISSPGTFEMNFGTLYGIPLDQISDEASSFNDMIPVANFHPSSSSETTPVPINEIYSDIVSEIETATKLSADSSFKLSNISLKLKAVVHKDGETMSASLLDLTNSETVNGDAISEFVFDITPNQTGSVERGKIPDLIGLTETAVRRILRTYDLKLNPVYQQNTEVVNGDSFKQSPNVGGRVPENKVITVIFSKNEQS